MDKKRITSSSRSFNMSMIRSKNTKPEIFVRNILFSHGYRYRLHSSKIKGKPDIIFQGRKKVIFVHGCFWHRHENCKFCTTPKTNKDFWIKKFQSNLKRDNAVQKQIVDMGWKSLIIWECETKEDLNLIKKITEFLGPVGSKQNVSSA